MRSRCAESGFCSSVEADNEDKEINHSGVAKETSDKIAMIFALTLHNNTVPNDANLMWHVLGGQARATHCWPNQAEGEE